MIQVLRCRKDKIPKSVFDAEISQIQSILDAVFRLLPALYGEDYAS